MRIFLYPYAGVGGRNYLKQIGTLRDIELNKITLRDGLRLSFYCGDANDAGQPDDLLFEGTVYFDTEKQKWYVVVDENSYRRASESSDQSA